MNILITGSKGFIGKNIFNKLSKCFIVYGIFFKKRINKNYFLNEINIDISKIESLDKIQRYFIKKDIKIDIIIHTAFKVFDKKNDIQDLILNNLISYNVATLALKLSCKKIINFSSMSVYPYNNGNFDEKSKTLPQKNDDFFYGLSKLNSEMIFKNKLKKSKCKLINLRISQVYGQGMNKKRTIPIMLNELKNTNKITVYGNGVRTTNFIEINELIKIIKFFLNSNHYGVFNIGKENISLLKLANNLINQYGKVSSKIIKIRDGKKEKFKLDTKKIEKLIRIK